MKTYDERAKDILSKLAVAKRRRKAVIATVSLCCCMVLIVGILLIPMMQRNGNPGNPSNPLQLQQNTKPGTTTKPSHQDSNQNSGTVATPPPQKPNHDSGTVTTPSPQKPNQNSGTLTTPNPQNPNQNSGTLTTPNPEKPNQNFGTTTTPNTQKPNENSGTTTTPNTQKPNENSGTTTTPNTQKPSTNPVNLETYAPLIQQIIAIQNADHEDFQIMVPTDGPSSDGNSFKPVAPTPDSYEEVTDNQVQGITEADLIKRSDKYIFYLRDNLLSAYSINGKSSKQLGSYEIGSELSEEYFVYDHDTEMYLSQDCKTITVISSCHYQTAPRYYLYIVSLDVSNPKNIHVVGSRFLKGDYESSRLVGNDLYVISTLYLYSSYTDPDDARTFLPSYGVPGYETYLSMDDIFIPEAPSDNRYTIVTKLDNTTLQVEDTLAMLSYGGTAYMSQENIYLVRHYEEIFDYTSTLTQVAMSEILRLSYGDSGMEIQGVCTVEGYVSEQYRMDEHEGILRVVTTINHSTWDIREYSNGYSQRPDFLWSNTNASLYCIDLTDHSIRAKVEHFAPPDESVRSVRFDGDSAYVCTSIQMFDPVFFFDLSNLDNITYKDTGTIDGFSMSLVDFADGFLLGIGRSDFDTLKIEMYREAATTVESHCVYEYENCSTPWEYKGYYIDRENQLIGMGVRSYEDDICRYILLHFDGQKLVELLKVESPGLPNYMRAVYIDGYLYILGESLQVEFIGK